MPIPARLPRRPRAAFTLIELLTVIAIIGILAAILIPVVGKVRSTARTAKCVSNLRQMGQATIMFAADNKNLLPVPGATNLWPGLVNNEATVSSFQDYIATYLAGRPTTGSNNDARLFDRTVLQCPSGDRTLDTNLQLPASPYLGYANTAGALRNAIHGGSTANLNITRVATPSRTVILLDYDRSNAAIQANNDAINNTRFQQIVPRHDGRMNYAALDGSVRNWNSADHLATTTDTNQFRVVWQGR
jgi:general secretion pathway protein G